MSFAKIAPTFARASSEFNVRRFALNSGGRLRSTLASTKQSDEQNDSTCTVSIDTAKIDLISQTKNADAPTNKITIDFENTEEAYKSKSSLELLRSLLVFKLCSLDFLVDKNKELMDFSRKLLGQKAFEKMMKMTFYGQFVAGENHQTIKPLIQRNEAFGVGSVLDYSVEEDLTQEEAEKKEMESCVSEAEKDSRDTDREYHIAGEEPCCAGKIKHSETLL